MVSYHKAGVASSRLAITTSHALLAQLVELLTCNQAVARSIRGTRHQFLNLAWWPIDQAAVCKTAQASLTLAHASNLFIGA